MSLIEWQLKPQTALIIPPSPPAPRQQRLPCFCFCLRCCKFTFIRSIPASMRSCSTNFRAWAMLLVVDIVCHPLEAPPPRMSRHNRENAGLSFFAKSNSDSWAEAQTPQAPLSPNQPWNISNRNLGAATSHSAAARAGLPRNRCKKLALNI